MSILIVTEKPSVARELCSVIGADNKKKGFIEGNGYIVSWCLGHLVGLKFPNDYGNSWADKWSFSQLPMIPDEWLFKVNENTDEQFHILKDLMSQNDVTAIICATDADREGELIFRYVYNMVGCRKPVMRLWVSSLEESAVRKAFADMKPMNYYDNLFSAGFSRAKADWLVGMNFSRLFSCRYNSVLNIGRVQTPALAMIVKRDYEVNNFVKQKYFTADLDYNGCIFSSAKIDDENTADMLISDCTGRNAVISSVKREIKSVNPPKLYDLTSLQRDANKIYGYTAQQTLDCIQSLYESKLVTYPRTDSQFLSDDMEQTALEVIGIIGRVFPFGNVINPDIRKSINNSKVTGHHAIIPTTNIENADLNSIPTAEKNILFLIADRLLCASASVHKYESVKIIAVCNDTEFTANGKTVTEIGWKQYAMKSEENDVRSIPPVSEGQIFSVNAEKSEHFTSPPKSYTEDTLLSAMEHAGQENYDENSEKKGIGTPATRAGIIEGLVKKGYAERKGRQIISTEKGKSVINAVPDEIKSAKLTADWEMKLQQMEQGKYSADDFMTEIEEFIRSICIKYGSLDSSVSFGGNNSEPVGKCPKCQSDVVKGKYGYYCKDKCGMSIAKVYGKELSENQIIGLLSGKSASYTANGIKTTVLPETAENNYNGKTYYQWKTERGNENGK